jgi:hypothetical protein
VYFKRLIRLTTTHSTMAVIVVREFSYANITEVTVISVNSFFNIAEVIFRLKGLMMSISSIFYKAKCFFVILIYSLLCLHMDFFLLSFLF